MSDRSITGFKLYQKGKVKVTLADEEYILFEVAGSNHETHQVDYEISEGAWRCLCTDYDMRHQGAPGSFLCKHILACIFQLAELKGIEDQQKLV